jgi:hypothetical protein
MIYYDGAVKTQKTWRLKTKDGRAVYQDFRGNATFEDGSNAFNRHPKTIRVAAARWMARTDPIGVMVS